MAVENKKRRVATVIGVDGRDEASVSALAASVAGRLERSLATAILESAAEGHAVVLGDEAFLAGLGLSARILGDWPERLRQRGEQVLFLAVDGRIAGVIGIVDAPE